MGIKEGELNKTEGRTEGLKFEKKINRNSSIRVSIKNYDIYLTEGTERKRSERNRKKHLKEKWLDVFYFVKKYKFTNLRSLANANQNKDE